MTAQSTRALGSRYLLTEVIGRGAMGEVWLAEDSESGQKVAAKLLRAEVASDPAIVGRFIQERAILLKLVHPNVVRVRDMVVEGDDLALIMDLVDGADLRYRLRAQETLTPQDAVRYSTEVLDALAAAHALNILHRDVKPDNVLLDGQSDPPSAKLTDFSIARLAQETTVRMTGIIGTAEYIAPEVFTSESASAAVDVYGTGILLYELLAGRTPFGGGSNHYAVARRHVEAAPPPIPGLPQSLAGPLEAMLAKSPAQRPTAAEAAAELRRIAPGLVGLARLDRQSAPVEWQAAAGSSYPDGPAVSVRGHSADGLVGDPDATNLKGGRRVEAPSGPAAEGVARALSPGLAESVDGATSVRSGPSRLRPHRVDLPTVAAAEPTGKSRTWILVTAVLVVAVVMIAAVGLLVVGRGSHTKTTTASNETGADNDVTAEQQASMSYALGGYVQMNASYDPQTKQVSETVTVLAPSQVPVSGPFLVDLEFQGPGGAAVCPNGVTTSGALTGEQYTPPSGLATCEWQIGAGATIVKAGSETATFTFPETFPTSSAQSELDTMLTDQAQQTTSALQAIGNGTSAFAVQRLQALEVNVTPPTGTPAAALLVSVLPVWVGSQSGDSQNAIFVSKATPMFQDTALLDQMGGQSSFQWNVGDCSGSVTENANLTLTWENSESPPCEIAASIGDVSGTSGSIDLSGG